MYLFDLFDLDDSDKIHMSFQEGKEGLKKLMIAIAIGVISWLESVELHPDGKLTLSDCKEASIIRKHLGPHDRWDLCFETEAWFLYECAGCFKNELFDPRLHIVADALSAYQAYRDKFVEYAKTVNPDIKTDKIQNMADRNHFLVK